jgi:hypothetical protein
MLIAEDTGSFFDTLKEVLENHITQKLQIIFYAQGSSAENGQMAK